MEITRGADGPGRETQGLKEGEERGAGAALVPATAARQRRFASRAGGVRVKLHVDHRRKTPKNRQGPAERPTKAAHLNP